MTTSVPAYGIALLRDIKMGPAIAEYLERIDATLEPYGGKFIVHGAPPQMKEGDSPASAVVIIQFPDRATAEEWYASGPYQDILPLRTENSQGNVFIVDGVKENHRATDVLTPR